MTTFSAPKGTFDLYSPRIDLYQRIEAAARRVFTRHGFSEIRTPIFEETGLFVRGVGEGSDLVHKQMYTFTDRGGRSLTLRPEGTAAVVRALIENRLINTPFHQRVFYMGPMFRHERPQKGRHRQFHQIGVEAVGEVSPEQEANILEMLFEFLDELDLRDLKLTVNSIGDNNPDCQPKYVEVLREFIQKNLDHLCNECHERSKRNVLRCLDCKSPECKEIYAYAPTITSYLCRECAEHHKRFLQSLRDNPIFDGKVIENPFLVRGLDYYRRTAFEISAPGLGAQDALLGGGRYDDLVKELGGPSIPGFGFGIGLDRLALSLEHTGLLREEARPLVIVLAEDTAETRLYSSLLASALRKRKGMRVYQRIFHGSPGTAFKWADRLISDKQTLEQLGYKPFAILIGSREMSGKFIRMKYLHGETPAGAQSDLPFDRDDFSRIYSKRAEVAFNDLFESFLSGNQSLLDEIEIRMRASWRSQAPSPKPPVPERP